MAAKLTVFESYGAFKQRVAEELVGHSMPPLLRRLYLDVGNGGFGPGYGVLGLRCGHGVAPGGTVLDRFACATSNPAIRGSLVPVCGWGCAIESYVDWADPEGRIWGTDQRLLV